MSLIKVENLSKEFKIKKRKEGIKGAIHGLFTNDYEIKSAVQNVSFTINKGEIVGYIGPNGAGKSTTIKMLVGILVPTSGIINVSGITPYRNRVENAKKIGVVFGQRTQLWWDIPIIESLNLMKHMYKIPEKKYKENLEIFSEVLDIDKFINIPVRQLSLGQRMRADLCASMLHDPEILYLDEPTIGLDVVVKESIRDFIKEINRIKGTTIIITTHDMLDIEKLCSRIILIDKGKIMYDGDFERIKKYYGSEDTIIIKIDKHIKDIEEIERIGAKVIKYSNGELTIKYDKRNTSSALVLGWIMERGKILDFQIKEIETEQIIRELYKDQTYFNV